MVDVTFLQGLWFVLIGVLWIGYFVLEGFDFGVGMLLRLVARTDAERRAVIHSIGPVWDGNEVWLLVAGGATFAAFPEWYATLFSGFYLALFLILAALIVRGMFFELWGKREDSTWRRRWEVAFAISSFLPALLWGVGWANIVGGSPIGCRCGIHGNPVQPAHPLCAARRSRDPFPVPRPRRLLPDPADEGRDRRALAHDRPASRAGGGLPRLGLPPLDGDPPERPRRRRGRLDRPRRPGGGIAGRGGRTSPPHARAAPSRRRRSAIVFLFSSLFANLFPNAMVSSTNSAYDLTLSAASSSHYTLTVMTVVAVALVPLVLLYQGWTYWVFRARIGAEDFGEVKSPLDLDRPEVTGQGRAARR